jgi:tRNA nucleotidyltransferase/poly(A) polymerase
MLKQILPILKKAIRKTEFEGKVYFAGGCVRDEILSRQTDDIDVTVELPEGGIRLAELLYKCGVATKPIIYKQFGTALVQIGKHKTELVMTRRESYRHKSRKPEVEFGTLEEDVLRRDFTVNSLLKNVSSGEVIDLSGIALDDIKAKLIRATSAPEVIFKEDPLRLLRAVRFATVLGFEIERNTLKYIKHHASALKHISRERIADETLKIIGSVNWLKGLQLLAKTNLKRFIFPGLRLPSALYSLPEESYNLSIKLGLLLYSAKDATTHLKNLKLSKQDITYISKLINECKKTRRLAVKGSLQSETQLCKRAYELEPVAKDFSSLYEAAAVFSPDSNKRASQACRIVDEISRTAEQMRKHRFSLTGDDLIRTFCIKSGPKVGKLLARALAYWFKHPKADKTELLGYLGYKKRETDE